MPEVDFMFPKVPKSDKEPDFGKGSLLYPVLPLLLSIYYKLDSIFVDWNIHKYLPHSPGYNELQVGVGGFIIDTYEEFELSRELPSWGIEFVGGMHIEKKKGGIISQVLCLSEPHLRLMTSVESNFRVVFSTTNERQNFPDRQNWTSSLILFWTCQSLLTYLNPNRQN